VIRLHAYIGSGGDEGHYRQLSFAEGRYVVARLKVDGLYRVWKLVATRQPDGSVLVELVTDTGDENTTQTLAHLAEVTT
jgi:hypothetical protein